MKKTIIIILILITGLVFAVKSHDSYKTPAITVTSAYATTTDTSIGCAEYAYKFIHIKNIGAVNAMSYKAWGYADGSSSYYEEFVAETEIAASGSDDIKLANTSYAVIVIRVKSASGTTCEISYNMIP